MKLTNQNFPDKSQVQVNFLFLHNDESLPNLQLQMTKSFLEHRRVRMTCLCGATAQMSMMGV